MQRMLEIQIPESNRGRALVFLHEGNTKKMVYTIPVYARGRDQVYKTVDALKDLYNADVFEWNGRSE